MKTVLIFALGGVAALSSAQAIGLASPDDWTFSYAGSYDFAAASGSGNVSTLLGTTLGAQLSLLHGSVTDNQSTTLSQMGASVATSPLTFTDSAPAGLLPSLGAFLVSALSTQNGAYAGTLTGTSLALSGPSVASVTSTLDTRIGGTGLVYSLKASVVGSSLAGTVDDVSNGVGDHVTGTAGRSNLIALSLGASSYVGGFLTATTPLTQVGAIETDATSWSLARTPVQAAPEPASAAAFGVGAIALIRRRRKAA